MAWSTVYLESMVSVPRERGAYFVICRKDLHIEKKQSQKKGIYREIDS
jgi:hypothetical protein